MSEWFREFREAGGLEAAVLLLVLALIVAGLAFVWSM